MSKDEGGPVTVSYGSIHQNICFESNEARIVEYRYTLKLAVTGLRNCVLNGYQSETNFLNSRSNYKFPLFQSF